MMGSSSYKDRTELIRERATGIAPEVDPATARRFADGHRFEALARPLAEEIIGEELYPVVGVADAGKYSASFDGITMLEDVAFEHKSLNDSLREAIREQGGNANEFLPDAYKHQMEHQCMVCPTIERILFMASKWDAEGNLIEERHCWYTPDLELRAKIVAGWKQFEADVADFTLEAKAAPVVAKPTAKIRDALPVLVFNATGEVTESNVDEFKAEVLERINTVNATLVTDQDFADGEADAKWLRSVSAGVKAVIQRVRSGMTSVNEVLNTLEQLDELAAKKARDLEKLVNSEKDARRQAIVMGGSAALRKHLDALNTRLGDSYMPMVPADFGGAVKGKRNLDSMQDAVNTELARAKISANEIADRIGENIKLLMEQTKYAGLFPDFKALVIQKQTDDLKAIIAARLAKHEEEQRATLERIRKEEQERADREAREKLAQQEREAEALRQEEARKAQAAAEEAERARREEVLRTQEATKVDLAKAVEQGELAEPLAQDIRAIQDDLTSAAVSKHVISAAQRTAADEDRCQEDEVPTLRIGHIAERLGWSMTAEQLRALGFEPAAKEKGAVLYRESQFPGICAAIAQRALTVRATFMTKATAEA